MDNPKFDLRWLTPGDPYEPPDDRHILGRYRCETFDEDPTTLKCVFQHAGDECTKQLYDTITWKEQALSYAVDKLFTILSAQSYKCYKFLVMSFHAPSDSVLVGFQPVASADPSVIDLYKIIYFVLFYHLEIILYVTKRLEPATGLDIQLDKMSAATAVVVRNSSEPELFDDDNGFIDDEVADTPAPPQTRQVWADVMSTMKESSSSSSTQSTVDEELDEGESSSFDDELGEDSPVMVLLELKRQVLISPRVDPKDLADGIDTVLNLHKMDPVDLMVNTERIEKLRAHDAEPSLSRNQLVGTIFQIVDLWRPPEGLTLEDWKVKHFVYNCIFYLKKENIPIFDTFKSDPQLGSLILKQLTHPSGFDNIRPSLDKYAQ